MRTASRVRSCRPPTRTKTTSTIPSGSTSPRQRRLRPRLIEALTMALCKAMIIGNLGADPEKRSREEGEGQFAAPAAAAAGSGAAGGSTGGPSRGGGGGGNFDDTELDDLPF